MDGFITVSGTKEDLDRKLRDHRISKHPKHEGDFTYHYLKISNKDYHVSKV